VRKRRHVAAARHLEQTWPGEAYDIAEVLASHYLEAIRADPEADDVDALRAAARDRLAAAGRAAASLALGVEADRYFQHAAELADEDGQRAVLFEQAGNALAQAGDDEAAEARLREAIELHERAGSSPSSAAISLGSVLRNSGKVEEALEVLEPFRSRDDPHLTASEQAAATVALAGSLMHAGRTEEAGPLFEAGLLTLEAEQDWPALTDALVARAAYLIAVHRLQEGVGVLRHALVLASEHDLPTVALRARFNLAGISLADDRFDEAIAEVNEALAVARERGDRSWEYGLLSQGISPLVALGRWDEAAAAAAPLLAGPPGLNGVVAAAWISPVAAARGDEALLEACRAMAYERRESAHIDERACSRLVLGREAAELGDFALARAILEEPTTGHEFREQAYAQAVEAAQVRTDDDGLTELDQYVTGLRPAEATPLLRAGQARVRAELAHRRGDDTAARDHEQEALTILRKLAARPFIADTLVERARRSDETEPLSEARAIYADLRATRRLAQIDDRTGLAA
jgi:tetratricopeptide (TPR) repeat protein